MRSMRNRKDKDDGMQAGEWVIRARSRTGLAGSVHYGTQADIDWHAQAARNRGDEIEEHRLIAHPIEEQPQQ